MRIFRNLKALPTFKNAVVTIGTYDGVHVGHQKIIQHINELARENEGESILITFHPHPRTIVNTENKVELLSLLDEKFDLLEQSGVDNVVVVPFTRAFSQQSPEAYVKDFLVKNFQPSKIVIGYDHKFGKNRAGDLSLLKHIGLGVGFEVVEIPKQVLDDLAISSTKTRNALKKGAIQTANAFLGHPYFIRGIVVKGNQLGRTIGFPTANISLPSPSKLIPTNGVYAVVVHRGKQVLKGMLNIGVRPTISGEHRTIEVNLFNFDENIYGEQLQIDFKAFIRAEKKFNNLPALVAQLQKDEELCRLILSSNEYL